MLTVNLLMVNCCFAQVVELVYTRDLKSLGGNSVRVQLPPWAQKNRPDFVIGVIFIFDNIIAKVLRDLY